MPITSAITSFAKSNTLVNSRGHQVCAQLIMCHRTTLYLCRARQVPVFQGRLLIVEAGNVRLRMPCMTGTVSVKLIVAES